ncbi:glycerophosphoryl diester phosphodiesterase [Nitrospirillum amazonense]|uniref:Glycerophosphoryl diester phosphodiesterase n=1 Tax=Nitrospirillum amazonense TaxID=28077 RepID=A0A560FKE7_9PROT|nr:glycerophosphodiester phosphodiesterase [Nitrospirillum amazonense]TWB22085.1 glycerophosphoryl diester phosphodiesterase [Nitrospirillum amazonense]
MSLPHRLAPRWLTLAALLATAAVFSTPGPAQARDLDIEAHRGGRALWPENTLQSFAHALSLGVTTLEMDMNITKDGTVIISHERHLNPDLAKGPDGAYVTAPTPAFFSLTLDEIKKYDVGQLRPGSAYGSHFPDQRPIPGTPIPTLKEVIDLVKRSGNKTVKMNIETKIDPTHPEDSPSPEVFVDKVLAVLKAEKFEDRVMIQSFDWRTLQVVQQKAPTIPTVYLTEQDPREPSVSLTAKLPWTAGFDPVDHGGSVPKAVKAAGGKVWSPLYTDIDAGLVAEAHSLGLTVVPWTVNKPEDMAKLIDMGVDGIISDQPVLLRAAAAAKGIALPKAFPVEAVPGKKH